MNLASVPVDLLLSDVRTAVGESPLWSVAEQALWWVDIEGRLIHRLDWATRKHTQFVAPERVGCVALFARAGVADVAGAAGAAEGLLAAMETGIFHFSPASGAFKPIVLLQMPRPNMRFNDGRVDRQGRFWVTTMVRNTAEATPDGALYRLDARGLSAPQCTGLYTGNGSAFSPDGKRMYLSDSNVRAQRIWQFDLHDDGSLGERALFVDMNPMPGRPDGAAVDVEGCYWICAADAGRVHRFRPDGTLDQSLVVPVSKPSMCSFGGPALDHLFITSITPAQPVAGFDAALDGGLFVAKPGVKGVAELPFLSN